MRRLYLTLDGEGCVETCRIAFGGMAGTPKRATSVENALIGRPWSWNTVASVRDAFDEDYQPLTDCARHGGIPHDHGEEPADRFLPGNGGAATGIVALRARGGVRDGEQH